MGTPATRHSLHCLSRWHHRDPTVITLVAYVGGMPSLEELLTAMDRTSANLAKLDTILQLATPNFPSGPSAGSNREYEDLRRNWSEILSELPPINGCRLDEQLP